MSHVFRATKIGWEREQEVIWFDSGLYTREQALAEFKPFQDHTLRGYPYQGYTYDGQKYHDVMYLGECEDDQMPRTGDECIDMLLKRNS